MHQAAVDLKAGEHPELFISMITSRSYSDVINKNKEVKNRLKSPREVEER